MAVSRRNLVTYNARLTLKHASTSFMASAKSDPTLFRIEDFGIVMITLKPKAQI